MAKRRRCWRVIVCGPAGWYADGIEGNAPLSITTHLMTDEPPADLVREAAVGCWVVDTRTSTDDTAFAAWVIGGPLRDCMLPEESCEHGLTPLAHIGVRVWVRELVVRVVGVRVGRVMMHRGRLLVQWGPHNAEAQG